jgi:GlcNAc-P-P-Und epimerase
VRVLVTGGSGFIGTSLMSLMEHRGYEPMNLDIKPPPLAEQRKNWRAVDILDRDALGRAIATFLPTHIVHLAALATFEASDEVLRTHNVGGTANVLDAALGSASLRRIIVTSTQYVNGPGASFDDDLDFHPVNDYGKSKVAAELLTRQEAYNRLDWAIVRPTNIWGPHHPRFPEEMWLYIKRGLYLHPGFGPIIRAYGYVENVARQIDILLHAPAERVRHRVFYLTDPPIDSFEVLNGFSLALRRRPLKRIPYSLLRWPALAGDAMRVVGLKAPFHSDRLQRMTSPHGARYEPLWDEFAYQPIGLTDAISRTVAWLKQTYPRRYA